MLPWGSQLSLHTGSAHSLSTLSVCLPIRGTAVVAHVTLTVSGSSPLSLTVRASEHEPHEAGRENVADAGSDRLVERLRRQAECVRHSQRPIRHAGLYITPAARDRSDEQMAPPRAPDAQAPVLMIQFVVVPGFWFIQESNALAASQRWALFQGPPGCPYFLRYRCPRRMSAPDARAPIRRRRYKLRAPHRSFHP